MLNVVVLEAVTTATNELFGNNGLYTLTRSLLETYVLTLMAVPVRIVLPLAPVKTPSNNAPAESVSTLAIG
jgi:hypothetical protein